MKYINGVDILPEELLNEIKKYVEGVYLYIPKSDQKKNRWGENTNHHREMELRNLHIYDKYLAGIRVSELTECYHLSDKSIRRIISSQKRRMENVTEMIKEILKEWNLSDNPVQIHHSAWSVNEDYVIKEYSDRNALIRNLEMLKILHKEGVPVPRICPLPNGREFYEMHDKMYMLTTKLKGKNIININQCDEAWFFQFGTILAKLHIAFQKCEKTMSFWNNSLLEEMNGWVSTNLKQFSPDYLLSNDINRAILQLSQVYQDLPKQLIHRDVHLGNFLFEGKNFTGYIDFDLSQSNIRIFDLCYFLLGILMKEDNNRINAEPWFMVVQQVIEGYHSLVGLEPVEKRSIPCVMKNIELLFTAYFLSIGDEKLAKDSADLFHFVCKKEEKILNVITK
jgi:Ser/Thr protein kinase RdoA (MazF antagonist)